jgi:hypothetical protein
MDRFGIGILVTRSTSYAKHQNPKDKPAANTCKSIVDIDTVIFIIKLIKMNVSCFLFLLLLTSGCAANILVPGSKSDLDFDVWKFDQGI